MEPAAIVLTGGTGARMGGADKATVRWQGRTLLDHALATLAAAGTTRVVVVGDPRPTPGRSVVFAREDPPGGGPGAGLLAGLDALLDGRGPAGERAGGVAGEVVVLAVDMPGVDAGTLAGLRAAARGRDGAVLVDTDGRRQLAMVLDAGRVRATVPGPPYDGAGVWRLLAGLALAEVEAVGDEGDDVDTWRDLDLRAVARVPVTPVAEDGWERWARLRLAALADAPEAFSSRLADWSGADEARWRARMRQTAAAFLIATADLPGRVLADVGMVAVAPSAGLAGAWELTSLWVDPAVRGRGVTDALVAGAVIEARRGGAERVTLRVRPSNRRALAAYGRLGFAVTGEIEGVEPGEPGELVMERRVAPDS